MNSKKLEKHSRGLAALRRSPQKARSLEEIAKKLGRENSSRGKEPNWISKEFPQQLRPISIPHHGGRDLSIGVRDSILNSLEDDICAWEERLAQQQRASKVKAPNETAN